MSSYKHFDPKVIKKRTKSRAKSSSTRFELYVLKTNKHIVAVLYDKLEKRDVTSVSTRPSSFVKSESRANDAFEIGKKIATICKTKDIASLCFNKLNYKFHGLLKEVSRGVQELGINI
ncbi:MAG: large subunit ribosomal protein L18 [Candidatus Deianiraeaceae bacterium]|jgi:large subunit ribosomal protein L18